MFNEFVSFLVRIMSQHFAVLFQRLTKHKPYADIGRRVVVANCSKTSNFPFVSLVFDVLRWTIYRDSKDIDHIE